MTVSGRTKHKASRQPDQRCESQTQKMRATLPNRGRLERSPRRANCCRSARFSSARWRRDFRAEQTERNRASRVDHMEQGSLVPSQVPVKSGDRDLAKHGRIHPVSVSDSAGIHRTASQPRSSTPTFGGNQTLKSSDEARYHRNYAKDILDGRQSF